MSHPPPHLGPELENTLVFLLPALWSFPAAGYPQDSANTFPFLFIWCSLNLLWYLKTLITSHGPTSLHSSRVLHIRCVEERHKLFVAQGDRVSDTGTALFARNPLETPRDLIVKLDALFKAKHSSR